MIAPPSAVASPGRRRARTLHKENSNTRGRAQTVPANNNYADGGLSFGDAVERSASPMDRQPIPQNNDLLDLGFLSQPAAPAQPFSAPNPGTAGATQPPPQDPRAATTDDIFDFFGDLSSPTTASSQPPAAAPVQAGAGQAPTLQNVSSGHKKKKKKKKKGRNRAQTDVDGVRPMSPPAHVAPPPPQEDEELNAVAAEAGPAPPRRRMKQIDVLPLLHQGIRMNKFKFAGNGRPKPRTFFLSQDNKFFCWEAKGAEALAKSADDRQVYLGQIRQIRRNDPSDLATLSDIRHRQFTVTIVYVHKGGEKSLNIMAFNAFHYQLISEGLENLVSATNSNGRDLADIFELYLDFDKDILPDHLKPQRFKWEALKEDDITGRERTQTAPAPLNEPNMFTTSEGRERLASF